MKRIVFVGKFGEYFLINVGLTLLSIATLGLGFIYQSYWNKKYFADNLRIEK